MWIDEVQDLSENAKTRRLLSDLLLLKESLKSDETRDNAWRLFDRIQSAMSLKAEWLNTMREEGTLFNWGYNSRSRGRRRPEDSLENPYLRKMYMAKTFASATRSRPHHKRFEAQTATAD